MHSYRSWDPELYAKPELNGWQVAPFVEEEALRPNLFGSTGITYYALW